MLNGDGSKGGSLISERKPMAGNRIVTVQQSSVHGKREIPKLRGTYRGACGREGRWAPEPRRAAATAPLPLHGYPVWEVRFRGAAFATCLPST